MDEDFTCWQQQLQGVLDEAEGMLRQVVFFRATDSTQDAARRMRAQPGDVIVAARQTAGRGRLGRKWADTQDDGIAVTMVIPRERGGRLAIAGAVAAAMTAETVLSDSFGIKWPNDVQVGGRKLAGVLVEQIDSVALVGVGMNILQAEWPSTLVDAAVSLRQLGAQCGRLDSLKLLLAAANRAFAMSDEELVAQFTARDVLVGQKSTFHTPGGPVTGVVLHLDPLNGLRVACADGEHWLEAATTSLRPR